MRYAPESYSQIARSHYSARRGPFGAGLIEMDRKTIIRRYRKVSWGRLYWKKTASSRYSGIFNSDDVCCVVSGPVKVHYQSIDRLIKDIEEMEKEGALYAFF